MISEYQDQLELTVTEAARAARVDRRTIRRRLDGGDFPHARREAGSQGPESGPWLIPAGDLVAAGLTLHDPTGADDAALASARAEVDALRAELADAVRRAEVAEARAAERERVIAAQELALRALVPGRGDGPTVGDDGAGGPVDDEVADSRGGPGPAGPALPGFADAARPFATSGDDGSGDEVDTAPGGGDQEVRSEVPPPVSPYPETASRPPPTFSPGAPRKTTPPWVPIEQPPRRRRRWQLRP